MTNFLHWRKMTWTLVLWSAVMSVWILIDIGMAPSVAALWVVGAIALGLVWLASQPPFRQGRGLSGFFVRPGPGQWRVANLHRDYWATDDRRDLNEGRAA